MTKIALVTGAAGFIGSHMVDLLLKKKFKVFAIDNLSGGNLKNLSQAKKNKKFFFYKSDINKLSKKIISKIIKSKYIYHFAGKGDIVPSIENPKNYIETNSIGTLNLVEIFKKKKIKKFIYAASSSCYGLAQTPTSENCKISCEHPYALSKYIGEEIVLHWGKVYKMPVISIRIFNAYGLRSRTNGNYGAVFGVFLKQKILEKPLTLVGNGKQKRDFVYVTDVVNAFYRASISKHQNQIYNLGAGSPVTILELIKMIKSKYIKLPERPGEPKITWANISKIKKHLKWDPKISFDIGVKKMLNNIDYWKDAPLWNKKKITIATKNWFKFLS